MTINIHFYFFLFQLQQWYVWLIQRNSTCSPWTPSPSQSGPSSSWISASSGLRRAQRLFQRSDCFCLYPFVAEWKNRCRRHPLILFSPVAGNSRESIGLSAVICFNYREHTHSHACTYTRLHARTNRRHLRTHKRRHTKAQSKTEIKWEEYYIYITLILLRYYLTQ